MVDDRTEKQIEIPLVSFRWCIDDLIGPKAQQLGSMPSVENIAGEYYSFSEKGGSNDIW